MNTRWEPPTRLSTLTEMAREGMADVLGVEPEAVPEEDIALVNEEGPAERELCPGGCRREAPLFELVEIPEGLEGAGGARALCGACRERLDREGTLPKGRLLEALGAPSELIQRIESARSRRL